MNTVKISLDLPEDVVEILNGVDNRSKFIAEAVREYNKQKSRERLLKELKDGYKAVRAEDKEIMEEWESTVSDGI